ncbi:uncharacterized protein LOC142537184 [Primulina tabacum]|uniref:uncharacterized protein LOC142537184 n=1 Tax=Primulina tabacum TaxID=48773 RepID=UPI003F598EF0
MEGVTTPPGYSRNSSQSSSFLTPLLISMVGIVATSVAIIVYHLFLVKYCLRWRRQEPVDTVARAVPVVSAGVEKKVLDSIPVLAFSSVKGGDLYLRLDKEECVVCLGELEDEDLVRLLPNCKHAFHVRCVDQWFLAHTSCPLCRSSILTQDNPKEIPADTEPTNYNPGEEAYHTPDNRETSLPCVRPFGRLRHCMSLELPHAVEMKSPARPVAGLNRSISMDPSFAVINIQNEGEFIVNNPGTASSSSRSKMKRSESYRTRPVNQIDRMSSKLMRSFSRLRLGKGGQVGPILPY